MTTENEPVGFDDFEFVDEQEWPEVNRVEFSVVSTVSAIDNLAQGLDVVAASFGRYGLDGFTILAKDMDSDRAWVLKNSRLFTAEEFVAQFEKEVSDLHETLTPEEQQALRESDQPVAPDGDN